MTNPDISSLPPEGRDALKALARAAYFFRGVFIEVANDVPIEDVLAERQDMLMLANDVLDKWLSILEIDSETGEDMEPRSSSRTA